MRRKEDEGKDAKSARERERAELVFGSWKENMMLV